MNKQLFDAINNVLAEWDPIGVGETIATDEYVGYIPLIFKVINNKEKLLFCLEDILVNKIGLEYDSNNEEHFADLQAVCDKITRKYKEAYR